MISQLLVGSASIKKKRLTWREFKVVLAKLAVATKCIHHIDRLLTQTRTKGDMHTYVGTDPAPYLLLLCSSHSIKLMIVEECAH